MGGVVVRARIRPDDHRCPTNSPPHHITLDVESRHLPHPHSRGVIRIRQRPRGVVLSRVGQCGKSIPQYGLERYVSMRDHDSGRSLDEVRFTQTIESTEEG